MGPRLFFLLSLFFFHCLMIRAQEKSSYPFFISLNYRTGENEPHRDIIMNLKYPYRGVDLKLGWQTTGLKDWQLAYRYPSLGIGFNWNTFETEVLGNPVASYFFVNFPQITTSWFRFDLETDLGLSYGINPYNAETNPYNFSTGTTVNVFFGLYLEQSFHILPQADIFCSEGLTHYSNGALGFPNYGLNIPSLKFGVRYLCHKPEYIKKLGKPDFKKQFSIITYVGGGTKKLFGPTPSYNEVLVSPSVCYRIGFKRRLGLGLEVSYNEAIKGVEPILDEYTLKQLLFYGVYFSHEFIIDRFTILAQLGIYLKDHPAATFYYERVGFGYYVGKNIRVMLNLKAHYIKAEYVEAGIAYDLKLN